MRICNTYLTSTQFVLVMLVYLDFHILSPIAHSFCEQASDIESVFVRTVVHLCPFL